MPGSRGRKLQTNWVVAWGRRIGPFPVFPETKNRNSFLNGCPAGVVRGLILMVVHVPKTCCFRPQGFGISQRPNMQHPDFQKQVFYARGESRLRPYGPRQSRPDDG